MSIKAAKYAAFALGEFMNQNIKSELENLKDEINGMYGFEKDTPRINYGPCAVFAYIFYTEWNKRFDEKVHLCFVMTRDFDECFHTLVSFSNGLLYDGGVGLHSRDTYGGYILLDMLNFNKYFLDMFSYGLGRTYPRFCPDFSFECTKDAVCRHLDKISSLM